MSQNFQLNLGGGLNMDSSLIAKQMIDFQRTTFNNTFNFMAMLQDHTEKTANTLVEQATWFPEEGKRVIGQWVEILKKGRNDMKSAVDDNYSKMMDLFSPEPKVMTSAGDSTKTNKKGRK
jgi:polyhydroxyalkanoate synthesis regulator phasin